MVVPVIILYIFSLINFFYYKDHKKCYTQIGILFLLMVAISIFRPETMLDYQDYKTAFEIGSLRMEPSFVFISHIIKSYSGNFILIVAFYSLLGISLKLWIIHKLSISFWISVLIYIANFYLLHDMIQMRVSIAGALFLIALYFIHINKRKKAFLLISISILFHYSSIVLLLCFLINNKKINKLFYFMLIPACYILVLLNFDIVNYIRIFNISFIQNIFDAYEKNVYVQNSTLNIFNVVQLLKVVLALLLLSKIDIIKQNYPLSILLIKIYIISISTYALFSNMPVLAVRISELLGVVEILLIPCLYRIFKPQYLGKCSVVFISTFVFLMNIFHNHLLNY